MFHRFFKVVVHRPIDLSAFPVYSDAGELENVTFMILDVDLDRRTITLPEGASGTLDLDSYICSADAIRVALDCNRDGILEFPLTYKPTATAVMQWFFRYVHNVIGGIDNV